MDLYVDIRKKLPGFTLDVKFESGSAALGLLGASGSGKSMTLRCIAGLEKPDSGKIILNGRVLFDSEKGINIPSRKRKIGILFQNYALFPNMTVEENIGFALENLDKTKRNETIGKNIEMIRLQGLEKRYPFQLSGGQQQRVALARALAIEPEALLLDEPFSALDDHLRNHMVKQLMDTLNDYHGVTLFVTHNMEEAYRICKNLVILTNGSVEAKGGKEELFQTPPTFISAQLTGCKNISSAGFSSPYEVNAHDWGITIKTDSLLTQNIKYVGIQSHYIRLACENDEENIFSCWPSYISEAPFKTNIYLSLNKEPSDRDDYQLQWEISREEWINIKERALPWNIYVDPLKLIILDK
ncbi:sulfate/thiosulfate import ATP-binding protein CysA [Oxobacter pfennigii]|uniref:Sulfate/thiosulfate import ATP-binding protein CysA n=1 Tax=Oxobacter pfennigii TaxID=36849 RepID=A0A0P8WBV5_9CLOT|nr:sulfate/molybdate ABC transporter ATP-binding protein [Oxobacter pfennigii]KPU46155.1 sulfate/thiosulfate import ATP-binding protein CysA [Oxobacter pfennigii]